jgi:2-C-methyl-D-erythritol 4-phosphate cytidylyltransferase/2-C-methyl-D-erythritol 2,4-cyclodiphosphate synthase
MVVHAVHRVAQSPAVDRIIVVVRGADVELARVSLAQHGTPKVVAVVAGADHRQGSVQAGLAHVGGAVVSVVHDGARPLVTPEVVTAVVAAATDTGAATAGVPVRETVKRVEAGAIAQTLDRERLWIARTPQAFRTELLLQAHHRASADGFVGTDDAVLVERLGQVVRMVEDVPQNIKITVPSDLELAEMYLAPGRGLTTRTGIGYDAHRLVPDRPLRLGGVEIPSPRGLSGHSDADVLVHAVMDALLGAAGLGDIGLHFPSTDPAFKDADSVDLLRRVAGMVTAAGWQIAHVDSVVLAELPRLAPHLAPMRQRLAAAMGVATSAVSIKATTTEGLGAIGRGEGIAAQAVATLGLALRGPRS